MIAYLTIILLISGFIFTQQYPIAKFKQLRAKDLTLYWHIFTWGLVFAGFSVLVVILYGYACDYFSWLTTFRGWINPHKTHLYDYLRNIFNVDLNDKCISFSILTILLSFITGFLTAHIKFFRLSAIKKITKENDLQNKLFSSTKNGDFVQITLLSRKVYVGLVVDNRNDKIGSEFEYIVLLPLRSGYRTSKSMKIKFTNHYADEYLRINEKYRAKYWYHITLRAETTQNKKLRKKLELILKKRFDLTEYRKETNRFSIVIPVSQIAQIGAFDYEAYLRINDSAKNKLQNQERQS